VAFLDVISEEHTNGSSRTDYSPVAAAGYSLVYLLAGGGFFGAIVIFIIAKMIGK
jgi:hypothetical protein